MGAPHFDVRVTVVGFQVDFEVVCEQIDRLGTYKALHDQLHKLQFIYNCIIEDLRLFPDDEGSIERLTDYAFTIQSIIDALQRITQRARLQEHETTWIQQLVQAQASLPAALERAETMLLKQAVRLLNRVLTVQPFEINIRLNAAARALRLPALANAMTSIYATLSHAHPDFVTLYDFQESVAAVTSLSTSVLDLVASHDAWQIVDRELRRIETFLDYDTTELEASWPDLKTLASPLYCTAHAKWAIALSSIAEQVDRAIAMKDPIACKRSFRRYRRQANDRFYQVDDELKQLCEELRKIGEPLATVLRMIK